MKRPLLVVTILALFVSTLHADTLRGKAVCLTTTDAGPLAVSSVSGPDGMPLFMSSSQPTWALVVKPPTGDPVKVDPVTACLKGITKLSGGKLVMQWQPYAAPGGPVTVTCTFEPDKSLPLLYGRITVNNASDCGLTEVQFPCLTLSAAAAQAEHTTLVFPRAYGRSWRNPFNAPEGFLVGTHEPYGHMNPEMQMGTLVDDDGHGLYWAAYDGACNQKRFVLDNPAGAGLLHVKIGQRPENNLTPGVDYVSPYPIVLGAYTGDWWDAAHLYRQWALKQKWCRRGPLEKRADVPQWIKEADLWVRGNGRYGLKLQRDFCLDLQKTLGGTVGLQYYNWTDNDNWSDPFRWPPSAGFAEFADELAAEHVMVMPYVNALQWDTKSPSWKEEISEAFMLDAEGKPIEEETSGAKEPYMICADTKLWHDTMLSSCERLVKEGKAPGIYLDQLGNQGGIPCYNPAHGHPLGGGSYGTDGLRRICGDLRSRLGTVNPNFAIAGEVQGEAFIDVSDVRLNHYNNWPGWVNLWAAVYGDQTSTFGRTMIWRGPLGEGDNYYGHAGNTFVSGMQFGRIWPTGNAADWMSAPGMAEQRAYLQQLLGLRRTARKFLEFGWLQRPVKMLNEIPQLTLLDDKRRQMQAPAVLATAWAAHDGTIGFVFCNTSTDAQPVRWQADLARHEIAKKGQYRLTMLLADGTRKAEGELRGTLLERAETMPPHSAFVLEVAAK